ncbi:AMP-binding protein [Streptomyces sp. NBC_00525]|uniref:AMP-binding protein n=1 Tax=Streptomyces sp. NBC_00525 TaxID=2903660 RepID=UPI002E80AC3D|nr:AMP-binding protein [Streptomyces sp. NBC_00525]WUC97133.1 AMP-binding protein [Streptomyces sp. NBC_00525]
MKRAHDNPHEPAFTFLEGDLDVVGTLTYGELHDRARELAGRLRETMAPGDRVLLLYPAGLDYIVTFFGCLYAGVIAVPLYVPQRRTAPTVEAIARDCAAGAVLTTEAGLRRTSLFAPDSRVAGLPWLATDRPASGRSAPPEPDVSPETIAYLQYTSGSTSTPKGVVIDHRNAVAQCAEAAVSWQVDGTSRWVSWLPHFHDYGQIGSVLLPVYAGCHSVLMAPTTFVRRPIRWLQAISRYHGTHTGAPNFAYDLCVDATTEEQRAGLDLSSLITAGNGAEPVQYDTHRRFSRTFTAHGLKPEALCPSYGLAEATLKVTNKAPGAEAAWGTFDRITVGAPVTELPADDAVRPLVSCGTTVPDTRIAVVEPETRRRLPDGHAGEVWVNGPSVARGYWGRPEESEQTFRARVEGDDGDTGTYLRTGDLGFLHHGELYLCGRLKDLVIIDGVNHYPQDIERTAEDSDPAVRRGRSAAFSVRQDGRESLVVVAECAPRAESRADEVAVAIRDEVWRRHEIGASVVVTGAGGVPVTTSGKIRRSQCRADLLEDRLTALARLDAGPAGSADAPSARPAPAPAASAADALRLGCRTYIEGWVLERVLEGRGEVDARLPLSAHGVTSRNMLELHYGLEEWSGLTVPPEWMWETESIDALAGLVAQRLARPAARTAGEGEGR